MCKVQKGRGGEGRGGEGGGEWVFVSICLWLSLCLSECLSVCLSLCTHHVVSPCNEVRSPLDCSDRAFSLVENCCFVSEPAPLSQNELWMRTYRIIINTHPMQHHSEEYGNSTNVCGTDWPGARANPGLFLTGFLHKFVHNIMHFQKLHGNNLSFAGLERPKNSSLTKLAQ